MLRLCNYCLERVRVYVGPNSAAARSTPIVLAPGSPNMSEKRRKNSTLSLASISQEAANAEAEIDTLTLDGDAKPAILNMRGLATSSRTCLCCICRTRKPAHPKRDEIDVRAVNGAVRTRLGQEFEHASGKRRPEPLCTAVHRRRSENRPAAAALIDDDHEDDAV